MSGTQTQGSRGTLLVAAGIGALFVVLGVALLLLGEGPVVLAGVACIGIGASAVVAVASSVQPRRRWARTAARPSQGGIRYPRSGTLYADLAMGLGAAVFLVPFILLGLIVGQPLFSLVGIVMFLLIVPMAIVSGLRRLRDPVALELTPTGLRTPDLGSIPWTDIDRLEIEDLRSLHAEPGVTVIGDTRQLAIHLRDGAEPPRPATLVDRAYREMSKGYLALGRKSGRGSFHWLAIQERGLPVPLEEVLEVASDYREKATAGLASPRPAPMPEPDPPEGTAATISMLATDPNPIVAAPAGGVPSALAAEAAAFSAARRAEAAPSSAREMTPANPAARLLVVLVLGAIAVAIAWLLGAAMVDTAARAAGGVPWPFISFGLLLTAIRGVAVMAPGRWSWLRRPLSLALLPTTFVAFAAGAFFSAGLGTIPGGGSGQATTSPMPSVAITMRASSDLPEGTVDFATDGRLDTVWNSGEHPPGWIEIDLGVERSVRRIRLLTEQLPAGRTIHRIHVAGDAGGAYRFVHEFDGVTDAGRWLEFAPPEPLQGVRSIVVETLESPSWVAWREVVVDHD